MTSTLFPSLTLGRQETPTSYISRLAQLHRAVSARLFCTDLGFTFQPIVDGDAQALAELATLTGAPEDTLAQNAITADGTYWRLAGQLLHKSSMQRTSGRVCRACVAADIEGRARPEIAAYGRAVWQIVSIRTCPIHSMPIVEAVPAPQAYLTHDFATLVGARAVEIARLAGNGPTRALSAFERYLLDRLAGATHKFTPWLDSLDFAAAARACEIVGAVRMRGRKARAKSMTEADWHAAAAAGFDILCGGEPALRGFLEELDATYAFGRHGNEGPQAVLGDLYKWLSFQMPDAIFDPIRDVVRRHIVETMPVAAGETVLGKIIEKRTIHSIHSASVEYDVHHMRLRKILNAGGLIQHDMRDANDNRVRFPAEAAAALIAEEKDAISFRAVRTYVNADRVHTKLLADHGFIKPTSTFTEGSKPRYAKAELDAFLQRLTFDAEAVAAASENAYTIPAAAKRANCSAAEIIRLILDRKLGWTGRLTSERGYLSVLVDLDHVKSHVHAAPPAGLTPRALEKRLRSSTRVVTALIEHGHLPTRTVVNPVNRCPMRIVMFADVEKFEATYAHLHAVARQRGRHFNAIKAALTAAGVSPALDPALYHATFYRRAEANRALDDAAAIVPRVLRAGE